MIRIYMINQTISPFNHSQVFPSSMNHAKHWLMSIHRSQFIPSIYLFIVTCNLNFNDNVWNNFDSIESSILLAYNNDKNTPTIVGTKIIPKDKWCPSFYIGIFYIGQNLDDWLLLTVVNFYNETTSWLR